MSGGVPTVKRPGPRFPAEQTQTTPYLSTISFIKAPIRLKNN